MAPSSAGWHPGGTGTRLLSSPSPSPLPSGPPWSQRALRESWWQGGPSGLVMRLPVEPGCGLLMLELCRVRAGVRTSRKGEWMLAAPPQTRRSQPGPQGPTRAPGPLATLLRTATVRPSGTWNCTGWNPNIRTGMQASYSQRQVALTGSVSPGEAQPRHSLLWLAGTRVIPASV